MVPVNYFAILASTVVMIVLGFLWYGPLFGKQWIALMKFSDADMASARAKGMTMNYTIMALGALVMSFVLAHSLIFASTYLGVSGIAAGLMTGFWNWIGFIAPVTLGTVLWEGRSWKLWLLNTSYYLVGLLIIGVLLSLWV